MNYSADHVQGPKLLECQTCVFLDTAICVNQLAVRLQHENYLGNEIHKLLELLFRALARRDISNGGRDNYAILGLQRAEADLYGKLRSISPDSIQFLTITHWAYPRL